MMNQNPQNTYTRGATRTHTQAERKYILRDPACLQPPTASCVRTHTHIMQVHAHQRAQTHAHKLTRLRQAQTPIRPQVSKAVMDYNNQTIFHESQMVERSQSHLTL